MQKSICFLYKIIKENMKTPTHLFGEARERSYIHGVELRDKN